LVQTFGIIGVPWQDLADDESLAPGSTGLRFLTAPELDSDGRWPVVLGDPKGSPLLPPTDPFMLEELAERTGQNPITSVAPSSTNHPQC
jgi:hypothetical protein